MHADGKRSKLLWEAYFPNCCLVRFLIHTYTHTHVQIHTFLHPPRLPFPLFVRFGSMAMDTSHLLSHCFSYPIHSYFIHITMVMCVLVSCVCIYVSVGKRRRLQNNKFPTKYFFLPCKCHFAPHYTLVSELL